MSTIVRTALMLTLFVLPANAQQWRAQRILAIGEEQGVSFGRIADITTAPDGRFFVLDQMESRVHVFDAAGKPLRVFGKRGAGPGELSSVVTEIIFSRGQLAIIDALNQRLSLFETDGSFVTSRPLLMTQGMPTSWASVGDRLIYLARPLPGGMAAQLGGISKHTVFSVDPRSTAAPDTLLRVELPPDNEISMAGKSVRMKLNLRVGQLQLAGDGVHRVLLAASDTYRIRVLDASGKTTGWLSRKITRHRYSNTELARLRHQADSSLNAAMNASAARMGGSGIPKPEVEYILPEFAPVITGLMAGDRYVLVARTSEFERKTRNEWDVLGYDGSLLGRLSLPRQFTPRAFSGDRLYGVEKGELDLESVAVFKIGPAM